MNRRRMAMMAAIGALGLGLLLLPAAGVAQSETTTGTVIETGIGDGSISFVNGTTTGPDGFKTFSGTKQKIGPFTYFNFRSSDGSTKSGTAQTLGSTTFFNAQKSSGERVTGTKQEIGPFSYYSSQSSSGKRVTGTSQRIGNFEYFNFSGSDGSSTSGTKIDLGASEYFNIHRTEPVMPDSSYGSDYLESYLKSWGSDSYGEEE